MVRALILALILPTCAIGAAMLPLPDRPFLGCVNVMTSFEFLGGQGATGRLRELSQEVRS
jgi:hypothetical protein